MLIVLDQGPTLMTSLDLNDFLTPNTTILALRLQHENLGGGATNIQSMTQGLFGEGLFSSLLVFAHKKSDGDCYQKPWYSQLSSGEQKRLRDHRCPWSFIQQWEKVLPGSGTRVPGFEPKLCHLKAG